MRQARSVMRTRGATPDAGSVRVPLGFPSGPIASGHGPRAGRLRFGTAPLYIERVIELVPLAFVCVYFVPFMVAGARDHDAFIPILVVNALLGWTVVGWLACMVWAALSPARRRTPRPTHLRVVR